MQSFGEFVIRMNPGSDPVYVKLKAELLSQSQIWILFPFHVSPPEALMHLLGEFAI
jgi:hypothetical protein